MIFPDPSDIWELTVNSSALNPTISWKASLVPDPSSLEATPENVLNKSYKVSRPFLAVYKEENLTESGKSFIDFILSEEGQDIVAKEHLIKVK